MTTARSKIFSPLVMGTFHCMARCIRKQSLMAKKKPNGKKAKDKDSKDKNPKDKGQSKDSKDKNAGEDSQGKGDRRCWIEERIIHLAKYFAIDVMHMGLMGNHFHLVLRNLPQLVKQWSDREIMRRVIQIFPSKFERLGVENKTPTKAQLDKFIRDRKLVKEMRKRLSDISWFMRQLNQHVSRRSNAEDEQSGHFFESRFKSKPLLDETGVLICGVYIDLNQIRALEASRLEMSFRTGGFRRLRALQARRQGDPRACRWDGFLCPISTRGDGPPHGYKPAGTLGSGRASDRGVLDMTVERYLELVDWVGRQLREDKPGKVDESLPPILHRLGLSGTSFVTFVELYDTLFTDAVGTSQSLNEFAQKMHRKYVRYSKEIAALEAK